MKILARIALLLVLLSACGTEVKQVHDKQKSTKLQDSLKRADSIAELSNLKEDEAVPDPDEIENSIIKNANDSTILKAIYGSCFLEDTSYAYKQPEGEWEGSDTLTMKVEQRFSLDDSTQIVFIRGYGETDPNFHTKAMETSLILVRCNNGFRIKDAFMNGLIMDLRSVRLVYKGKDALLEYECGGSFGWGFYEMDKSYTLICEGKFCKETPGFDIDVNNAASESYKYNKMELDGVVTFKYDREQACFEFRYKKKEAEKGPRVGDALTTNEIYLMNADTFLLIHRDTDSTGRRKINFHLSKEQVSDALKKAGVRK